MICDFEDVRDCVEKYLQLSRSDRMLILDKHPVFRQFYFFLKGVVPLTLQTDLNSYEESQYSIVKNKFNSNKKIQSVDFTNPDEQYGYEGEIVFDISQSKYFRFGFGYLSDSDVVNFFGTQEDSNVELHNEIEHLELTEENFIETELELTEDPVALTSTNSELFECSKEYNPVSPDYLPGQYVNVNENFNDCSGGMLISEDEAEVIRMSMDRPNDNIIVNSLVSGENDIDKNKPSKEYVELSSIDLRRRLDEKRNSRINKIKDRRKDDRDRAITAKRDVNNSIVLYPNNIAEEFDEDFNPENIVIEMKELESDAFTETIKSLECHYLEREIIISSEARLRACVSGQVSLVSGYYVAKETNINFIRNILSCEVVRKYIRQMCSLQSKDEIRE